MRAADRIRKEARSEKHQRYRSPDASFRIAANVSGRRNQPCHHRWFGKVAKCELTRPRPILSFVEEKLDARQRQSEESGNRQRTDYECRDWQGLVGEC